jgi:hypothetical protein
LQEYQLRSDFTEPAARRDATQTADARLKTMRRHPPQSERSSSTADECRKWANFSLDQATECESPDDRAEWLGLAEAWIDLESSPEWAEEILHTGRDKAMTTRAERRIAPNQVGRATLRTMAAAAETLWRALTAVSDYRKHGAHQRTQGH